ncbi:MAG: N-acetylneuraminate synthase family protein [Clostridium sp.]
MANLILANGKIIGDFKRPYIIAELGSNHNGNMEIAKELILKAKEAGCDCVKFQSWSKNTIFSKKVYKDNYFLEDDYRNREDYTLEKIVDEFSISEKNLYMMKVFCDEIGIDFTSTPFSKSEVDFLIERCEVPFIKVASMDLNNYPFLRYIAKKSVPIIISTGLSEMHEIDKAIRVIEDEGNKKICILHCISIYPPEVEDINLNNILGLRMSYPEYPIGFSDHSLGYEIPIASVALGSCLIEKHFTLDKDMFGWDHKISADFSDMKKMVQYSENVYKSLGSTRKLISEKEKLKRLAFRRSVVAAKNLKKGAILCEDDLDLKRPGTGMPPEYIEYLIGKCLNKDIEYDEIIKRDDVL